MLLTADLLVTFGNVTPFVRFVGLYLVVLYPVGQYQSALILQLFLHTAVVFVVRIVKVIIYMHVAQKISSLF